MATNWYDVWYRPALQPFWWLWQLTDGQQYPDRKAQRAAEDAINASTW